MLFLTSSYIRLVYYYNLQRPVGTKKTVTAGASLQTGRGAVGKKSTTVAVPPTKQGNSSAEKCKGVHKFTQTQYTVASNIIIAPLTVEKNHAKMQGDKKKHIPVITKEDVMARKIQTCFRGYR